MEKSLPLSAKTRAIMLLCGHFGPKRGGAKPLTPAEYHRLIHWLEAKHLSLSDLLDAAPLEVVAAYKDKDVSPDRLRHLLGRSTWLAQAVDRWAAAGIWVMGEQDLDYPVRLRQRLKAGGSPLLFGAGARQLLNQGGICIVGSRDSTEAGLNFAHQLGSRCGQDRKTVISSDMRGVDREATTAALAAGGNVVSVVSDSLEKAVAARRNRDALAAGTLVLVTPFAPDTRFSVSNAMRVNKYQYTLADVAVIVETRRHGGVWSGADENRNEQWVPAFVRVGEQMSPGNTALLHLGLLPITEKDVRTCKSLNKFLASGGSGSASVMASATAIASATGDLYAVFLTALLTLVAVEPRTETEIMEHFSIERAQARKWLARAARESRIIKAGKPVRYRTAGGQL
ncbi:MAG: DNA-processing protein DprA [Acidiferrobacterales bacterium]